MSFPVVAQGELAVWPIPLRDKVIVGELNAANSDYVLEMLERATYACLDGFAAGHGHCACAKIHYQ
jgi:4-hydroxythreonine-4-phosphate dehydrogenase